MRIAEVRIIENKKIWRWSGCAGDRDTFGDSWKRTEEEIVCMLLENDQTMLYLHDLYNDA